MALSDCPKCWSTPCDCSEGYMGSKIYAYNEIARERDKLRADLEVAISALERLTNPELTIGHMHIARQALEKVRENG